MENGELNVKSKRKVYGVGINDSGYNIQEKGKGYVCPFYLKWRNMLQRCYSKNKYDDCEVCESWKVFSHFKEWAVSQDIPSEELSKYHLDKDLLRNGSKLYSPETCCFLPPLVNTFMTNCIGGNPLKGTTYKKRSGLIFAQVKNPITGKTEYLGTCSTREEGHYLWLQRKKEILEDILVTEKQLSCKIVNALRCVFN